MSEKAWKRFERRVGAMMGLPKGRQREGPTGLSGLDVQRDDLGVQCKYTEKKIVPFAVNALENAEKCTDISGGQRAVAVFGQKGWPDSEFVVALRFQDYLELLNRVNYHEKRDLCR